MGWRRSEQALREADVLSLHAPLTAATRGLLDRQRLAWLRPTALLVNTARGGPGCAARGTPVDRHPGGAGGVTGCSAAAGQPAGDKVHVGRGKPAFDVGDVAVVPDGVVKLADLHSVGVALIEEVGRFAAG